MKVGRVDRLIKRLKYRTLAPRQADDTAAELAQIVADGIVPLDIPIREYDIIVPMPTYVGDGERRSIRHVDLVLDRLNELVADDPLPARSGGRSPIVKTAQTRSMTGCTWPERDDIAITDLRQSLEVIRPEEVRSKRVLVFDDIFTTGHSLREVGLKLREAGATSVDGLVIARAQFNG